MMQEVRDNLYARDESTKTRPELATRVATDTGNLRQRLSTLDITSLYGERQHIHTVVVATKNVAQPYTEIPLHCHSQFRISPIASRSLDTKPNSFVVLLQTMFPRPNSQDITFIPTLHKLAPRAQSLHPHDLRIRSKMRQRHQSRPYATIFQHSQVNMYPPQTHHPSGEVVYPTPMIEIEIRVSATSVMALPMRASTSFEHDGHMGSAIGKSWDLGPRKASREQCSTVIDQKPASALVCSASLVIFELELTARQSCFYQRYAQTDVVCTMVLLNFLVKQIIDIIA